MLTRLSQPDSTAARNAADVLGEFHTSRPSPRWRGPVEPLFSRRGASSDGPRPGNINRPAVVAPLTAALSDVTRQVKTAALLALRNVTGVRDGSASCRWSATRTPACGPGGDHARHAPAPGRGAHRGASQRSSRPRYGGGLPGRSGKSTPTPPLRARRFKQRPPGFPSPLVRSLAGIALAKLARSTPPNVPTHRRSSSGDYRAASDVFPGPRRPLALRRF